MTLYAKITDLPAVAAITGPEQIEIVQAGVPARATPRLLFEFTRRTVVPIVWGEGDPTFRAPQGTLYSRIDATGPTNRLWINSGGLNVWAFFMASA